MAFKWLRKVITAKIETTYGVDAVPTGPANAVLLSNVKITPLKIDYSQRSFVVPYFGSDGKLVAGQYAMFDADIEMVAAGALGVVPGYAAFLKGCGLSETIVAATSVVYAPITTAEQSISIYWYMDGKLQKIIGAKGDLSWKLDKLGTPTWSVKFVGLYVGPTDVALAVPTYLNQPKPLAVNQVNTTPVTLHTYAGIFVSIQGQLGNQMKYRNRINNESVEFVDRQASGAVVMQDVPIATKDFISIAKAGTLGPFSLTHGTVAGQKVKIDYSNVQITDPDYVDDEGIAALTMGLDIQPSTAGNDEVTISFL